MKLIRNKILVLLLINSVIGFAQNINELNTKYVDIEFQPNIKEAQSVLMSYMKENSIPGLSITVADKSKIIWSEGIGYSDLEHKVPVKLNSKFRIGSVSKSLTSVALGKLIEEGIISLNDSLHNLVPYFQKKKHPITIKDLASHTSGIRNYNYNNNEYFSTIHYNSVEESTGIFINDSLLFKPNTKFGYSTYGYVLLSAVIEEVTNKDYLNYMKDNVFVPIGMTNTVPDFNDKIITNRVEFYQLQNDSIINAKYVDNSNKWAGGGFLSTSLDLAKMSQHLLRNDILSEKTTNLLWTTNRLINGENTNYGLGWRKNISETGEIYVHHGGSSVGGRAFLLIYPEEELIIAITCNLFSRFNEKLAMEILNKFRG